ncbi:MAG: hypothetical protein WA144_01270 [Candidatus Methanoperedens sp.]
MLNVGEIVKIKGTEIFGVVLGRKSGFVRFKVRVVNGNGDLAHTECSFYEDDLELVKY